MGRIKQLVLWSEEVMDEVYPHLSETDRELLVQHREAFDVLMNAWFCQAMSVEDAAKEILATVRDLQYDEYWNARETYLEAQWEARVA